MIPKYPVIWWELRPGLEPRTVWVVRYSNASVWLKESPKNARSRVSHSSFFAPTRLECLQHKLKVEEEYAEEHEKRAKTHTENAARGRRLAARYKEEIAKEIATPTEKTDPKPDMLITPDMV